jgi:crossover junction endodeoxyribonuclease RuvC
MTILGLDPGIDRLGWAVIKDLDDSYELVHYGLITTDKTKDSSVRLAEIAADLQSLLVTHHPDLVATEQLFFSVNVKTAMTVSEVRGVIKAISSLQGLEVKEVHPLTLKKRIVGSAKATKKEMQSAVSTLFNLTSKFKTDDVADAIAIAYVGMLDALGQI